MSKRLNLLNTIEARSSSVGKDSLIVNGIAEVEDNVVSFVSKRPGLEVKAEGTGTARGAFFYDNIVYYWDENTPNNAPLTATYYPPYGISSLGFWSATTAYTSSSDPVVYNNAEGGLTTWYPQRDSTGVTPVEGDDWSVDPVSLSNVALGSYNGLFEIYEAGVLKSSFVSAGHTPVAAPFAQWFQIIYDRTLTNERISVYFTCEGTVEVNPQAVLISNYGGTASPTVTYRVDFDGTPIMELEGYGPGLLAGTETIDIQSVTGSISSVTYY